MRCVACDNELSQKEESLKSPTTKEDYLMCLPCLSQAGILHMILAPETPAVEVEEDPYAAISMLDEEFQ